MKTILAILKNQPRQDATVLFSDATISRNRLSKTLRRDVTNITPEGRIELQKRSVQIARDVTRRTSEKVFKGILRAVLASQPKRQRVGVICHRPHVRYVEGIGEPFASRIVKTSYFGSGEDRSSNAWYRLCDLLVIAGTPRVRPRAILTYLFQAGEIEAACRKPEWGLFRWRGRLESGEAFIVDGRGYQDKEWQDAHRDIVRAQIVQAVGRSRGILADGCEVVAITTEECGLVLANNQELELMTDLECKTFAKIAELTHPIPNRDLLEDWCVKTAQIAKALGISEKHAREQLARLEARGLVARVGQRSGWKLADSGFFVPPESNSN